MTKFVTEVIERSVASLKPYARNARTHSKKQIKQIASSIERFGFVNPVLIGDDGQIIAGHGRVEAAKQLGLKTVPTLALSHLSETEKRAYVLADNKLALNAGWDREILAIELQGLVDLDFDVELTGFSLAEIDFVLDEAGEADPDAPDAAEDAVPDVTGLLSRAWAMSGSWDGTSSSAVMPAAAMTMHGCSGMSGSIWSLPTLPIMLPSTEMSVGWVRSNIASSPLPPAK